MSPQGGQPAVQATVLSRAEETTDSFGRKALKLTVRTEDGKDGPIRLKPTEKVRVLSRADTPEAPAAASSTPGKSASLGLREFSNRGWDNYGATVRVSLPPMYGRAEGKTYEGVVLEASPNGPEMNIRLVGTQGQIRAPYDGTTVEVLAPRADTPAMRRFIDAVKAHTEAENAATAAKYADTRPTMSIAEMNARSDAAEASRERYAAEKALADELAPAPVKPVSMAERRRQAEQAWYDGPDEVLIPEGASGDSVMGRINGQPVSIRVAVSGEPGVPRDLYIMGSQDRLSGKPNVTGTVMYTGTNEDNGRTMLAAGSEFWHADGWLSPTDAVGQVVRTLRERKAQAAPDTGATPLDTPRVKRDDEGMTTTAPSKPTSKLAYTRDTSLRYAYHQERLIGPPPGRNYNDPGMREWNDRRNQVMRGTAIRDAIGDQAARDAHQAGSVQQWLADNGYIEPNHSIAWNALTEKGRKLVESTSPAVKPEKREAKKVELPADDRVRAVMSAVDTGDQARALGFDWTDTPLNVGDEVMVDTFGKLRGGIVTRVGSKNVSVAYMTPSGGYTQTATRENKAIMRRVREADPRAFRGQALQPKPAPAPKPSEAERAAAKTARAEEEKAARAKRNEEWTNRKVADIRRHLSEGNESLARTEVIATNDQGLRAIARAFGIKSTPRGMGDREKTEWLRNEILDKARKPREVSGDDHEIRTESAGGRGVRSGNPTPAVVTCATCGARATGKTVAGAKKALTHREPVSAGKA